jgi:hypothetical protein
LLFTTLSIPQASMAAALRSILEPVLQSHNVDLVFVGHDHVYERTYPIVSAVDSVHPITYVTAGGGGAPRYDVSGDFFSARFASTLNYCILKIDGDKLSFTAYDGDAKELDSFAIEKSADGYAGRYLEQTASVELAAVEEAVIAAFGERKVSLGGSPRQESVEWEFTAPRWGDLVLSVEWRNPAKGARMTPENATLSIPAGEKAKLDGQLTVVPGELDAPSAIVTGKAKLGKFKVSVTPFMLK